MLLNLKNANPCHSLLFTPITYRDLNTWQEPHIFIHYAHERPIANPAKPYLVSIAMSDRAIDSAKTHGSQSPILRGDYS